MKLVFKTKPYPHQVRVLKFLLRNGDGGGINVPMRWGKSWVAINYAASLFLKGEITRALIITVTSGLGVLEDQVAEHCPVPWLVMDWHGEILSQSEDWEKGKGLEFCIVNYQNVFSRANTGGRSWVPVRNEVLHKFKAELIVADESHHLGKPTAVQSKHTYALTQYAKYRLFMTGTMFHRKPFFVFGQVKFYDDGRTFGTAWTHFKKRIAVMGGYGGYEVLRYQNLKWMMDSIRPFTHIEKYVPPRPPVINKLTFTLEGKHLEAYNKMDKDKVLKLGKETLVSDIMLTQHLRLLQIAGGFVKLSSGQYIQVGDSTLRMCQDRLEEYLEQGIEKAVVACRFIPELRAVALLAKKIGFVPIMFHGAVSATMRTQRIKAFKEIDKPALFISQISAGKESIDLSVADTMMWYSLTESYVEFDQFCKRIEKYGDKRVLQYDFLIPRGTQAEVAFEAMQLKQDVAEYIISDPERVERITAKTKWR